MFWALIGEHEEFGGGVCAVEKNAFCVVIVISGCVSASSPNLITVAP